MTSGKFYQKYDRDNPPSLYVHIPFCKYHCAYCSFYSVATGINTKKTEKKYFERLQREVEILTGYFTKPFPTVYIGGGTPNLPDNIPYLEKILGLVQGASEITVECNVSSLDCDEIDMLGDKVTRLSVGVQSFDMADREYICRIDDIGKLETLMEMKKNRKGFPLLNLDFITGIRDADSFSAGFAEFASRHELPEHVSLYLLTVEEGSFYEKMIKSGRRNILDDDRAADILQQGWRTLSSLGYSHYEVSAFERGGHECSHNLNYWRLGSYLGLGASAASRCFCGDRKYAFLFPGSASGYAGMQPFDGYEIESLGNMDVAIEMIATGLRTIYGVEFAELERRTGYDIRDLVSGISGLNVSDNGIWLEPDDFLFAEYYIRELVGRL